MLRHVHSVLKPFRSHGPASMCARSICEGVSADPPYDKKNQFKKSEKHRLT